MIYNYKSTYYIMEHSTMSVSTSFSNILSSVAPLVDESGCLKEYINYEKEYKNLLEKHADLNEKYNNLKTDYIQLDKHYEILKSAYNTYKNIVLGEYSI